MSIKTRYAGAVHSSNLKHTSELNRNDEKTQSSDADVLGAMGIADRALTTGKNSDGTPVRPAPLAVPLERLFAGDNNAIYGIVRELADMAYRKSFELRIKISRPASVDMARACIAWVRDGRCKSCGGHGYDLIPGTPSLSGHQCAACKGTGKVPMTKEFRQLQLPLALWLLDEIARESGRAGPQAMKVLAPSLNIVGEARL